MRNKFVGVVLALASIMSAPSFADVCESSLAVLTEADAWRAVRSFDRALPKNLHKYNLPDETVRAQLAMAYAKVDWEDDGDPETLGEYFRNFKISDENVRFQIANAYAAEGIGLPKYIENFDIASEKLRKELVLNIIKLDPRNGILAEHYQKFRIGKESHFGIALQIVDTQHLRIDGHVRNFDLDEKQRIQVARARFARWHYNGYPDIREYRISSENERFEIAKITMTESNHASEFLERYEITDPGLRIELARFASVHEYSFVEYAHNYGFTDQSLLKQLLETVLASDHPCTALRNFSNYPITDENYRYGIALQLADRCNAKFADHADQFLFKDQSRRVILAKIAASSEEDSDDDDFFGEEFKNFGITDEKARIEIAKVYMAHSAYLPEYFKNFEISDENSRFELAMMATEKGGVARHLENFEIHDKKLLLKLAQKIAQGPHHGNLAEHIAKFQIESEADRVALLRSLARTSWSGDHFANFGLFDQDLQIEVAKSVAKSPWSSNAFSQFSIRDESTRLAIARIAVEHLEGSQFYLSHYQLSKESDRLELAKKLVSDPLLTYRLPGLQITSRTALGELAAAFLAHPYNQRPDKVFQAIEIVTGKSFDNLAVADSYEELLEGIRSIGLNSEEEIRLVSEPIHRADVLKGLWTTLLRLKDPKFPDHDHVKAKDSHEFFLTLIGLSRDLSPMFEKNSMDTKGHIMALGLELKEMMGIGFLKSAQVDPKLVAKKSSKKFLEFLLLTRDLVQILQSKTPYEILPKEITESNIDEINSGLRTRIASEIFRLFEMKGGGSLSYEQIQKLRDAWGELSPLYTLVARFSGKENWKPEIPILGQVFSAALQNEFYKLKFEGLDQKSKEAVQKQLKSVNVPEWTKSRYRISNMDRTSKDEAEAARWTALTELLKTNLLPHAYEFLDGRKCYEPELSGVEKHIDSEGKTPVEVNSENKMGVLACFLNAFQLAPSKEKATQILYHIVRLKPFVKEHATLYSDFRAVEKLLKGEVVQSKGIVLTMTFWDPKWLLTVGDIVETGSCQNYRTGSVIGTLLGYVIDANVQGLASFVITPERFTKRSEYVDLENAIASGEHIDMKADSQFRMSFSFENRKITTEPVGKAYLRHILKVGQMEGGIGVKMERAYQQMHGAGPIMREQVESIFAELKSALDAKEGAIRIPKSRNPGGIYSDACGGVRTEAYIFN